MRIVLVALSAALVASVSAGAGAPPVGSAQYLVQQDPRLCPSPICGGYWVTLANRSQTRCGGDGLQARCYVARAVDERRHPLETGLPDGALARADIEQWDFEGAAGKLGVLVVAGVRVPAGRETKTPIYRVRDTGVRCVRSPCFSTRASRLSTSYVVTVSELDLDSVRLTPAERRRAEAALLTKNGLFAAGRIERVADEGRRFTALRIYLKA